MILLRILFFFSLLDISSIFGMQKLYLVFENILRIFSQKTVLFSE